MAESTPFNYVALVTGGASGIGKATVVTLATKYSFKVVIGDINPKAAEAVVAELEKEHPGAQFAFVELDVTKEDSWANAVKFTVTKFGALTTLINCAGIAGNGSVPFEEITLAAWQKTHDINATGPFLGCKAAAEELKKAGLKGSVVNVASVFALLGGWGTIPDYHSSKGALRSLTKCVALAWAPHGVRVNCVFPGITHTPILPGVMGDNMEEGLKAIEPLVPLGRHGQAPEIAAAIAFLAGPESTFMTGSEVVADGGYSLR